MNNVKKNLNNLLEKPMDRRDFLKHIGIGAVLVVGLGPMLKLLSSPARTDGSSQDTSAAGGYAYGDMAYGGKVTPSKRVSSQRLVQ